MWWEGWDTAHLSTSKFNRPVVKSDITGKSDVESVLFAPEMKVLLMSFYPSFARSMCFVKDKQEPRQIQKT